MNFKLPLLVLVVLVEDPQVEELLQDLAGSDRSCLNYMAHSYFHDNLAKSDFNCYMKYPKNNIFASVILFSASISNLKIKRPFTVKKKQNVHIFI